MCLTMANSKCRFGSQIRQFHLQNASNAMYAGFFGSAASVFGKLITYFDLENLTWENTMTADLNIVVRQWSYRLAFMAAMVVCNMLMWTNFVKALHKKDGTIVATVISAATNYCLSAALGAIIFEEKVSQLWIFGAIQVYVGIWYINKGNRDSESERSDAEERTEELTEEAEQNSTTHHNNKEKTQ